MNENKIKTAGLIVAAGFASGDSQMSPMTRYGAVTAVKRIVLTFQQASVSPIVVVTGHDAIEVERDLADYSVIFLKNENYNSSEMFNSAKIGLEYLIGKCDKVIFSPVNTPLFIPETLKKMLASEEAVIAPSYMGRGGHPLVMSMGCVPGILKYQGTGGMREAIREAGLVRKLVEIADEGILSDIEGLERLNRLIELHNQHILHPFVRISIEKDTMFFNTRTKMLLVLIQENQSVSSACKQMALSYSNAWNLLNRLEKGLGYAVVDRKHGGVKGGKTRLTEKGKEFLEKYQKYEECVRQFAWEQFNSVFL